MFFFILICSIFSNLLAYSGGSGTSGNPYQIANLNDLAELNTTSTHWNKYFIQTADMDAAPTSGWNDGAGFSPIGNETTRFSGQYDGQNYTIEIHHQYRTVLLPEP